MTQKILTATVECPVCGKIVFVYWGSFTGVGKKCTKCDNLITKSTAKTITRHF